MNTIPENTLMLECLKSGEINAEGQFMWGSNYTFLCSVAHGDTSIQAVYKPTQGERPLWDFPEATLSGREVAAYLVSEAGGWGFVPPTVYRQDGPAGAGSLQLYIPHDPEHHYFKFSADEKLRLKAVALFDAVINNTDRKGGHVLLDESDQLWLIDHGVCFHAQPKLRTVIWDFAGQPLSDEELAQIDALRIKLAPGMPLYEELSAFLNRQELLAMAQRIHALIAEGVYPFPSENRYSYPWPPV